MCIRVIIIYSYYILLSFFSNLGDGWNLYNSLYVHLDLATDACGHCISIAGNKGKVYHMSYIVRATNCRDVAASPVVCQLNAVSFSLGISTSRKLGVLVCTRGTHKALYSVGLKVTRVRH